MKFQLFLVLAVFLGLTHCFGGGLNQLMMQNGVNGMNNGYTSGAARVGSGAHTRTLKGFYNHAYDPSGYAIQYQPTQETYAALANLKQGQSGGFGASGFGGMGGGFGGMNAGMGRGLGGLIGRRRR